MADEVTFVQGRDRLLTPGGGPPATSVFLLSVKPISFDLTAPVFGDLYEGSDWSTIGEIAGWTGGASPYARKNIATPAPSSGIITYQTLADPLFDTDVSTDGQAIVPSLVLADPPNSRAYHAWDLRPLRATVTSGSHTLPQAIITVTDTSAFELSGTIWINGMPITYTGKTSTTLTGCSGGTGIIPPGTPVQQAPDLSKQHSQLRIGYDIAHAIRWFLQEP